MKGLSCFESVRSRIDRDSIDAFKGLFIILIVLGHVTLLSAAGPGFGKILYSFHVFAFLFLPFLYSEKASSFLGVVEKCGRYLVPYFFFVTFSALLFYVVYRRGDYFFDVLNDYFLALLFGSSVLLDASTGFQLYWFLPALCSLVCLKFFMQKSMMWKIFIMLFMLALHPLIGGGDSDIKKYVPFGALIAIYVTPLAVFSIWFIDRCFLRTHLFGLLSGVFFLILLFVMLLAQSSVNLAKMELYGLSDFGLMVLHDSIAMCGFVFLLALSVWYKKFSFLRALGRFSLFIYLVHSLIYQGLLMLSGRLGVVPHDVAGKVCLGIVFSFVTIYLAYSVSRLFFQNSWVAGMVFPAGFNALFRSRSLGK